MRKRILIVFLLSLLTGCSKINEIQYEAYAVGMGIDYTNNEYHVVLQFLDFSNVAKTEQGKSEQPSPIWIGSGRGKTIEEALTKIYHGIQIPVNYDQISLFVFGKSLLENRLSRALKALETNFNIRLTGLTYGTEEPLEKIFTTKVPFNYDYSNSRINHPEYMQEQDSSIPAISLQELIYQFNEKTKTIILPGIKSNDKIMRNNLNKFPVTTLNGAYLIKDEKLTSQLTGSDLEGFIHINNQSVRSPIIVRERKAGKEELVQIELLRPKVKRVFNKEQNDVHIGLDIKVSAIVRESDHEIILSSKIKREIENKIRNEVYGVYLKSKEIRADIYQFEDYMYRFMYEDWKKYRKEANFPSLNKKDIRVKIAPLKSINKINTGNNLLFNNTK
ncbi:Ger(x)C family spore germination protein [Neobacillus sp. PS3-12]|jgi:spore germination protein KC|uniref:Ger(x)C family spore germination protein n=1 Tax=Neobacillus sp. PS3-12 TaxID=3070677 RepID=UPI0027E0E44A|nr:Ger(x)C family spore germination protein [Neobacillus sp. PS3-12]WML52513.1 Ger(x)C family spore germination protein [Neobacillus sp. PS3-12]